MKEYILAIWNAIHAPLVAILLSMLTATLRIIIDERDIPLLRIWLETLLCGALTLGLHHAIKAAGLPPDWSIFGGAMIGYLGSNTVRFFAFKILHGKFKA